jgi:hypothetical protein
MVGWKGNRCRVGIACDICIMSACQPWSSLANRSNPTCRFLQRVKGGAVTAPPLALNIPTIDTSGGVQIVVEARLLSPDSGQVSPMHCICRQQMEQIRWLLTVLYDQCDQSSERLQRGSERALVGLSLEEALVSIRRHAGRYGT